MSNNLGDGTGGEVVMEIDKLQAGRELDALIAEKIMGCKVKSYPPGESEPYHCGCGTWYPHGDATTVGLERYSSDIAAAWNIHLKACSWLFSKRKRYFEALQEQTCTEDNHLVAWPDVLVVLRDRMPEAICRAALRAIGYDGDKKGDKS